MHIETLKVFCDLIETRSFSRAAERNFLTQSAVSQQVRALENLFGQRLVERVRGSVVEPTEAGKILYNRSRAILERYNRLEDEMMGRPVPVTGIVRVATINSVGLYDLPPYIKRFTAAYPQAAIDIQYCRPEQVYQSILSGAVDLGLVAYPTPRPQIEIIPFRDDQLVFVCSPDHPRARQRRVALHQLEGERFIGFEMGIPTREAIDRMLDEAGVRVNHVAEFDDIETIKRMIEIDAGVSILPDLAVALELKNGTLRALSFAGKKYLRPIAIIHKQAGEMPVAVGKLLEILTK
ncbi:MAG TPA: LysR family transcriptional regulator [Blastocatellia bacterium]|nr:LysR family transcriptional regulator [Blastocatellia bacterium]